MKPSKEYDNFDRTMRDLMKIPHEEIKAELEAEKAAKDVRKSQKTAPKRSKEDNDGK